MRPIRKELASAPSFGDTRLVAEYLPHNPIGAGPRRKKLAFVISHLGPGGAQRVVANAANVLAERGLELHLIVFTERTDAYRIDPRVQSHVWLPRQDNRATLDLEDNGSDIPIPKVAKPTIRSLLRLVPSSIAFSYELIRISAWLRRTIQRIEADAVLSFLTQTNILTLLATRGLRTRTVISERNDPRLQRHRPRVELLRRLVYKWADVVTANSRGALASLEPFVPKDKLAFLPNPLLPTFTGEVFEFGAPTVVTVGRLVEQKGLDVLLAAWASVVEVLPDWRLALVGAGPLANKLQALARELKIENNLYWIGHVSDPLPLLRGAEFFVLTSRFEGTPNALLEAMACGLPAVVSDASPGPSELIGPGESAGLIVPVEDAPATAKAILRLARDVALRRRLGRTARERARAYEANQAIEVWLRLLRCE